MDKSMNNETHRCYELLQAFYDGDDVKYNDLERKHEIERAIEEKEEKLAKIEEEKRKAEGMDFRNYLTPSLTSTALQLNWRTPTEFIYCPDKVGNEPLKGYYDKLQRGAVLCKNQYSESIIERFDLLEKEDGSYELMVFCSMGAVYGITRIFMYNSFFVHQSVSTDLGSLIIGDEYEVYCGRKPQCY